MKIEFYRESATPATWQPNSVYVVRPNPLPVGAPADYCEVYVVNNAGDITLHTPTWGEIDALVTAKMSTSGSVVVVNTIAERDAITSPSGYVYVVDASADSTVSAGGAEYLYNSADSTWIKTAESESMDIILNWASITDAPALAAVNSAVSNSHTHSNKTQLDKIGQDASGNMTYDGNAVATQWQSNNW